MPERTVNVTLELDGEALRRVALRPLLRGMRDRAQDFRPCYDEARNLIFAHEAQLFRQEGETLDESRWAELSPAYKTWKDKAFPGRKILELTGKLVRQLTGESGDHYELRRKTKLVLGSDYPIKWRGGSDDLGGLHMSGRQASKKVAAMPARPPIRTSDYLANELTDLFADYLMGVERPGFGGG